jgi:energy-converting hydrogenase Eha subunit G
MKIALSILASMLFFGFSLFASLKICYGSYLPWLVILLSAAGLFYVYKNKQLDVAGNSWFGNFALSGLGLILGVVGFASEQIIPTIIFLAEVWVATLLVQDPDSKQGKGD